MKSKIIFIVIILFGLAVEFSSCKKEDTEQKVSTVLLPGSITALNCGTATNNGTLTSGIAANSVTSIITYAGGNGGTHSGQTIMSTGVTGLTASLTADTFTTGAGNLTYTITGTPSSSGTASFALNLGGQSCTLIRTVNAGASTGIITTLNCGTATNNGILTASIAANGVNSIVTYIGGNGGAHIGQTVTSTGVTGLTATISAGSFANGAGNLTYTITGTPIAAGTASFVLNIGGQTCVLNRTVNNGGSTGSTASCGATNVHNNSLSYGSLIDQDGNVYKTIVIGTQEWMAENLKASHYRNGDLIPVITSDAAWSGLSSGATIWYNNDSATYNCPYGKLYNWFAVADSRNVCPVNWHVPSDSEWTTLTDYLGGTSVAGGKMKSTGTQYWLSPNMGADNTSGFSSLPNGFRLPNGSFVLIGNYSNWWSSSQNSSISLTYTAWSRFLNYLFDDSTRQYYDKSYGFSVRCLRD